jgi:hypothetical protein
VVDEYRAKIHHRNTENTENTEVAQRDLRTRTFEAKLSTMKEVKDVNVVPARED